MNAKEVIKCWVDRLRSDKYQQGKGFLHDFVDDTYCVLGVLATCIPGVTEEKTESGKTVFIFHINGEDSKNHNIIPRELLKALGLPNDPIYFWYQNDSENKSFAQFADEIEADYLK